MPAPVVIILTSTALSTWTVPADWNSADNTIEAVGCGANGIDGTTGASGYDGGPAGGGGAWAKADNVILTPGSTVDIQVAAGNSGNGTWLKNNSGTIVVSAAGATPGARTGGKAVNCVGDYANDGGDGGTNGDDGGAGGGGAAGPNGAGSPGDNSSSNDGANGGAANNGSVAGGDGGPQKTSPYPTDGSPGACDNYFDTGKGSGSGGGGGGYANYAGSLSIGGKGGDGGDYGGGGGGGGKGKQSGGDGGAGAQGLIVITYVTSTTYDVTVSASLQPVGSLARQTGKVERTASSPSVTVAHGWFIPKAAEGACAVAAQIVRGSRKPLSNSAGPSPGLSRSTGKKASGISGAAPMLRSLHDRIAFLASTSPIPGLLRATITPVTMAAVAVASLVRATSVPLQSETAPEAQIPKSVFKSLLAAALAFAASGARYFTGRRAPLRRTLIVPREDRVHSVDRQDRSFDVSQGRRVLIVPREDRRKDVE